jgi:hypothetical protein
MAWRLTPKIIIEKKIYIFCVISVEISDTCEKNFLADIADYFCREVWIF